MPPGKSRPRDRREQILRTATDAFAAAGCHRTMMSDIAAAIDVTPSALYRHFRNREDLFVAAVERSDRLVRDRMTAAAGGRGADLLERLVDAAIAVAVEHPAETVVYTRESAYLPAEPRHRLADRAAHITGLWIGALRQRRADLSDLEAELLARGAVGVLTGSLVATGDAAAAAPTGLWRRMMLGALAAERPGSALRPGVPPGPSDAPFTSRREDVLQAAARLFRTAGYEAVGIDAIGAAAGTSGPAVYRYYANKQQLLVAAFRRTGHRIAGEVAQAVAAAPTPEDALIGLLRAYADIAAGQEDLLAVYLREARSLPADARREMAAIQEELLQTLARLIRVPGPALTAKQAHVAALGVIGVLNAAIRIKRRVAAADWVTWATTTARAAAAAAIPTGEPREVRSERPPSPVPA